MPRYNVHEAKSNLSRLLAEAERGVEVVLCRGGQPIARLVPLHPRGFELGAAIGDPSVSPHAGDTWCQAMTDQEAEEWISGR